MESDYPGKLINDYVIVALDHTLINGSFEDAVLAKQIGRGQFHFGSDDVSAVFGFKEEKDNSGIARGHCIKENDELAKVVLKLHAIFKSRKVHVSLSQRMKEEVSKIMYLSGSKQPTTPLIRIILTVNI